MVPTIAQCDERVRVDDEIAIADFAEDLVHEFTRRLLVEHSRSDQNRVGAVRTLRGATRGPAVQKSVA